MILVVIPREPRPDAPYWPGRKVLASLDAVGWPLAWVVVAYQIPDVGRGVNMVVFVAVLCAVFRLSGAIFANHRYWFTTWWVLRALAVLLLVGFVMKLALWASTIGY